MREDVRFVYWRPGPTWSPELVSRDGDHDVWITSAARLPLDPKIDRDWSRAQLWNSDHAQAVVVPSANGMSVISVADGKLDEQFVSLTDTTSPGTSTQAVFDLRGVLAWSIRPGAESSVARFVDGKWTTLTPSPLWPKQLLHVVPFLDGTLLAISKDTNELKFRSVLLDSVGVDEANVTALVKKLADRNPKTREQAQLDIAAIGPGAWPILAKLQSAQPAEARVRIRALLGDQTTPTLGGVTPATGPGRMVCRLSDGGVVLYFAQACLPSTATASYRRPRPLGSRCDLHNSCSRCQSHSRATWIRPRRACKVGAMNGSSNTTSTGRCVGWGITTKR